MIEDLRTFLKKLKQNNEIITVEKEVDPLINLGGLAWQGENYYSKATYFKKLAGFPNWKAVSYVEASRKRMSLALNTTTQDFIPTLLDLLGKGPTKCSLQNKGPVKEIIEIGSDVDLTKIPIHIQSQMDAGRYMGCGMAIVKDPESGFQNVSLHRNQLKGKNKLGNQIHPMRHMDLIYKKYEEKNKPMPIAIAIGHHPIYYLTTCWTFPWGVNEFEMAGTFLGEPVRTVKAETVDLEVPADAEIIIEGFVPPYERELEGPFAEHTGYALAGTGENHFINVTAVTRRKDAIYYALQGGRPIASSQILDGLGMEVELYKRIKDVGGYVNIKDINVLPCAGGSHIVVVQFTPKVEGEAKDVLLATLSGPYIHPKIAIAVDDDIDIHNERQLFWSLSTRVDPVRDVFIVSGTHGHVLDASLPIIETEGKHPFPRRGSVMGIDATKPPTRTPKAREFFTIAQPMGVEKYSLKDFI